MLRFSRPAISGKPIDLQVLRSTCDSSTFVGLEVRATIGGAAIAESCRAAAMLARGKGPARILRQPSLEEAEAVAQNQGNSALTAGFVCLACAHGWSGSSGSVSCPKCGHLYVKWTNYDAMVERAGRPRGLMLQVPPRSQRILSLHPTPPRVGDDKPAPKAVARAPLNQISPPTK